MLELNGTVDSSMSGLVDMPELDSTTAISYHLNNIQDQFLNYLLGSLGFQQCPVHISL